MTNECYYIMLSQVLKKINESKAAKTITISIESGVEQHLPQEIVHLIKIFRQLSIQQQKNALKLVSKLVSKNGLKARIVNYLDKSSGTD